MAHTNRVPVREQGYPLSIFLEQVSDNYKCVSCQLVLSFPQQMSCGDRCCLPCKDTVLRGEKPTCPACMEPLTAGFRDLFAEREVLALPVRCDNSKRGCEWTGVLKDLDDHIAVCNHGLFCCSNEGCTVLLAKVHVQTHVYDECEFRRVACQYCGEMVQCSKLQDHITTTCVFFPMECGLCSKPGIPRKEMESHILTLCPDQIVMCPFSGAGCEAEFRRGDEVDHMTQNTQAHLSLLSQALAMKTRTVDQLNESVGALRTTVDYLSTKLKGIINGDKKRQQEILDIKTVQSALSGEVEKMNSSVARSQALQDVQMADLSLRVDIIDVKTTNGVLVWRIGDIARLQREAQSGRTPSLYSPPFYTSPAGYKMCVRVYLDGDGTGKGKCVSIFFVLMRGDYDVLLPWPFQLRVTMILMDQSEDGIRRHITEVFKPDTRSASFRKPSSEMNTGSGCPMFAPVTVLESPTYVKDDAIFIKVITDTQQRRAPAAGKADNA